MYIYLSLYFQKSEHFLEMFSYSEKYKIVGTFTRPPLSPPPKDEPTEAGPPAKTKETKAQVTIADPPEEITKKSSTFCGLL